VRELLYISPWGVFIFFLPVLLLLFTSFAVLLNCPYPDPRILPFSFDSPPHPSGGRGDRAAAWFFVASWTKPQGEGERQTICEFIS